mgnify:CR=1 FL=1
MSISGSSTGVGSEIALGHGVIGVAARENTPVRISHMTHAALYSHALRCSLGESGGTPAHDIPYPGLAAPHSQLALPLISRGQTLGVLFVESPLDLQFGYPDEDALVALQGERERLTRLNAAADAAGNAALLAQQQYASGLVDFQTVLDTQRQLLSAQDGVASTTASIGTGHVRLYKALGGGWQSN